MTGSAADFNDAPSLRKSSQQPFEKSTLGSIRFSTATRVIPRLIGWSLFFENAPPHLYTGQAFDTVTVMTTWPLAAARSNASFRAANMFFASPTTTVLMAPISGYRPLDSNARLTASMAGLRCACRKG
jgi:hypothetical protein